MPAVVRSRYGGPEHLRVLEVPTPSPRRGEVLVEVHAAGLDRGVWHLMAGEPYLVRLALGLRRPRQRGLGMDLAGRVVAVGPEVSDFSVGEEVFGIGVATFAGYARARADKLVHRPAGISAVQAAAVAISGLTAQQAVHDVARVHAGQRVLVLGASGGVGTYAVQIAKAAGAEVTGTASAAKLDLVRSLGADHVVDHGTADVTQGAVRYDVIIDNGGGVRVGRLRRILAPAGTLVIVGSEGGDRWTGGLGRPIGAALLSPFVRQRLTFFVAKEEGAGIRRLRDAMVAGTLVPAVGRVYPLEEVAEAIGDLTAGRTRGKSVVQVRPSA
ncbi:NAD(P)-dependent alcohol dehydrogenase [Actinotalea sp. BY-33]|uniref:NAD(P)-dependent alcohol dehydrogenase n=2 Tax=Actinotalea soli TaxID=2819234 RepID=A0A939RV49_9CELL|nr:NAD(P)-dependent alcohol dehydrogenase [Actinotalea soli]